MAVSQSGQNMLMDDNTFAQVLEAAEKSSFVIRKNSCWADIVRFLKSEEGSRFKLSHLSAEKLRKFSGGYKSRKKKQNDFETLQHTMNTADALIYPSDIGTSPDQMQRTPQFDAMVNIKTICQMLPYSSATPSEKVAGDWWRPVLPLGTDTGRS